jgi:hypothetical protein
VSGALDFDDISPSLKWNQNRMRSQSTKTPARMKSLRDVKDDSMKTKRSKSIMVKKTHRIPENVERGMRHLRKKCGKIGGDKESFWGMFKKVDTAIASNEIEVKEKARRQV